MEISLHYHVAVFCKVPVSLFYLNQHQRLLLVVLKFPVNNLTGVLQIDDIFCGLQDGEEGGCFKLQ